MAPNARFGRKSLLSDTIVLFEGNVLTDYSGTLVRNNVTDSLGRLGGSMRPSRETSTTNSAPSSAINHQWGCWLLEQSVHMEKREKTEKEPRYFGPH